MASILSVTKTVVIATVTVTVVGVVVLLWWMNEGVFSTQRFDQSLWREYRIASLGGDCARGPMTNDVIRRIVVPGAKRTVVEAQLGTPDSLKTSAQYELGMCSGFGFDYDTLQIDYEDGLVAKAYHVQH